MQTKIMELQTLEVEQENSSLDDAQFSWVSHSYCSAFTSSWESYTHCY